VGAVLAVGIGVAASGLAGVSAGAASGGGPSGTLRLGYFPNVTHAPALVGIQGGLYATALGPKVTVKLSTFNAGPAAVEALLSNSIDASYVGPNPAINAFIQSNGAVRVVAGAASGGAFLVVKPSIKTVADLKGKVLATPQLGNTQDVALRTYLANHGLKTDTSGGGAVSVRPEDNGTTVTAFQQGQIDGAWVPEPYAARLLNAGGKVLVDERTLWPQGRFVTTELVVRTDYLKAHPAVIQGLLQGQVAAVNLINMNPARAQALVGQAIQAATGSPLTAALIAASFQSITFTNDPIASSLAVQAQDAKKLGLLPSTKLTGLYDLTLLNRVLRGAHQPTVTAG
jgi:NitT/TauT family transport system substrate-binding protein